jgi:hypothetical protein
MMKEGFMQAAGREFAPPDTVGRSYQLVAYIAEHLKNFGVVWIPPTFSTFLCKFAQSLNMRDQLLGNTDVTRLSDIYRIIDEIEKFWRRPSSTQGNLMTLSSQQNVPAVTNPYGQLQNTNLISPPSSLNLSVNTISLEPEISGASLSKNIPATANHTQFNLQSNNPTTPQIVQRGTQQNKSGTQQDSSDFTGLSFPQAIDFTALTDSLTSEPEEDTLFTSLALLDPADW